MLGHPTEKEPDLSYISMLHHSHPTPPLCQDGFIKPPTCPPPQLPPAALPGPASSPAPLKALTEQMESLLRCRFVSLLQTCTVYVVWIGDAHPALSVVSSRFARAVLQTPGEITSIPDLTLTSDEDLVCCGISCSALDRCVREIQELLQWDCWGWQDDFVHTACSRAAG